VRSVGRVPSFVTVGETMAVFIRDPDGPADRYQLTAAGSESNVAIGLAGLGIRARWLSRLGQDDLGRFVHDFVAGHGVEVEVAWDATRPTASCVKEVQASGSRMRYYRSTSAARRLDLLDLAAVRDADHLHLTGVTPALSSEDRDVVSAMLHRREGAGRTSFDVNYRPQLWAGPEQAAAELVPLAQAADIVFIGDDEARWLLGTDDPAEVADLLLRREDQELVLKGGEGAAMLLTQGGDPVAEPAHRVEVVDLTGAGDAFAAGYLAARFWGWSPRARLRTGHLLASRVIGVVSDIGPRLGDTELADLSRKTGERLPETIGGRA
jgi:2-dehydro-3-deoxygluconokinase